MNSESGIGDEICRYQDVLQYALSKVDFNVGKDIHILPSNMVLATENRAGFNIKILVSEHLFKIGMIKLVNLVPPKEAFKTAPKEAFKTAPKEVSKEAFNTAPKEAF